MKKAGRVKRPALSDGGAEAPPSSVPVTRGYP